MFQRPGTGEWLFEERRAEEALCMIAIAGGDLARMLALWDAETTPAADLHLAALVSAATPRNWSAFPRLLEDGRLGDHHWDFAPDGETHVVAWLLDAAKFGRLTEAVMSADDGSPQAQALAEAADELQRVLVRRRLTA